MKNAIAYIRVSTEEQSTDDKFGMDVQLQGIYKYANENGYNIVETVTDVISGAKDEREGLDRILYRPEEFPSHEAVIVFKNDRVARDTKLYFYYFYTLEKRNVALLSTEEHFSEGDDFANIYRSLLMFVAEQERKNITLRTSKGRKVKAQTGAYSGGRCPYGYRIIEGNYKVDEQESEIVKVIYKERALGLPLADICDILEDMGYKTRKGKRFCPSGIKSILDNKKFYEGYYKYGDMEYVKGVHTPILA